MIKIGFVIVSHRSEAQLLRLVTTLNALYDRPPIACHHDFDQTALVKTRFPSNVRFVEPPYRTGWAKWSVVEASLAALELLYSSADPDWFVLLSASDYPVRPAAEVVAELASSPHDALLDTRPIGDAASKATLHGSLNPQLSHFSSPANRHQKWSHYLGAELWIPILRRKPRWRVGRYTVHLPFAAPGPFSSRFPCFYGDHWFTGNRRTARIFLNPAPEHLNLQRHLRMRTSPDECYYQTVLCNTPGLSICIDNKRWAEWNGGGAHPMELTEKELPCALSSGAHFARKFAVGSPVLDMVDREIGFGKIT